MRALVALVAISCGSKKLDETQLEPYWTNASQQLHRRTPEGVNESIATLQHALALDPTNTRTIGELELTAGYAALALDMTVELPPFATEPYEQGPGWISYATGRIAKKLVSAKNPTELGAAVARRVVLKTLATPYYQWIEGRVAMLEGNRAAAVKAFEESKFSATTPDHAQALADNNRIDDAITLANTLPADLMTALVGATIRAEAGLQLGEAATMLKLTLAPTPSLQARAEVANMLIALGGERYDAVGVSLKKLGSAKALPNDCWMWARIAFAYLQLGRAGEGGRGDFRAATVTRSKCEFPQSSPLLAVVDAGNQLALGNYQMARTIAAKSTHPWAAVIEAEAALELGDAAGAAAAAKRAPKTHSAPAIEALAVVTQQAATLLARGKDVAAELAKLDALTGKTQRGRHAQGAALFAIGDLAGAKRELRRAVEETTPGSPNPHGHRTRTLLAEIAIAEGELALAAQEIEQALAIHEGNRHTKSVQAQIALRSDDPARALTLLALLRKSGDLPAFAQLLVAEALVVRKEVTADERAQAMTLVTGLAGNPAIAPPELGRVAALVDPKLPQKLKLPVGKLPGKRT